LAKNNFIYSSFISGEISPKFLGRTDTQQYNQSCEELRNMIIYPQGGSGRRPGTISKLRLLKSDGLSAVNKCRLIPFQSTDGSRWQIMITDEDPTGALVNIGGRLTAPWRAINVTDGSVQNVTTYNNSPLYTPYHGGPDVSDSNRAGEWDFSTTGKDLQLNEIQYSQSGDTIILTHGSFRPIVIVYDPSRTYDSQFFLSGYANLFATPSELLGNGITTRTKAMSFIDPGNTINDITLVVPGSGTWYLTSAAVAFDATWEGRWIKLQNTLSTSAEVYCKKWNSGTGHLDVVWLRGSVFSAASYVYGPTTSGSSWTQGEWNDSFGWPKTVAFFDSRLVFGGTKLFPDKEWFSQIDNVFTMDPIGLVSDSDFTSPVVATDPFAITLKETTYSEIRWMVPKKNLTTGTNAAEFIVQGPDSTQSIGPTNAANNVETPYGSAPVQAIGYENTVVFLSRNRKSLHEMVYDLGENSFIAPDLNIISEHIANKAALERIDAAYAYAVTPGAFLGLTRQVTPYGMIWALDNNGCLAALTRDRNQNVAAWHFHEIVGPGVQVNGDGFDYKPFVSSISCVQKKTLDAVGTGGEPDELWFAVKRGFIDAAANGQVPPRVDMFIEKMALDWDRGDISKNWDDTIDVAPIYMDAAIVFNSNDNPAVESEGIIPVPHMVPGQSASVIMDGFDLGEFIVNANAEIDISARLDEARLEGDTNWQAVVGFNYVARINPVVAEAQAQLGSSLGQPRRIDQLTINFYRSLGVRFGKVTSTEEDNTPIDAPEEIVFPVPTDLTIAQKTYSGSKSVIFPQGYEGRPRILVESFRPLPCVITHIIARQVVYEQ
jgi:hypothetical protein